MRTWSDIVLALQDEIMDKEAWQSNGKLFCTDKYKEFMNEIIYHITEYLKVINGKVLKTRYSHNCVDIAFECKSELYTIRIYKWATRLRIYSIDCISDFDDYRNWYRQIVHTLTEVNPFEKCKLPSHRKFKVGDLVYVGSATPRYKKLHDSQKVLRITGVHIYSRCIMYSVVSQSHDAVWYTQYAEGNLRLIKGGV